VSILGVVLLLFRAFFRDRSHLVLENLALWSSQDLVAGLLEGREVGRVL